VRCFASPTQPVRRDRRCGLKNWLYLGNDDGGEVNATFVSLLASCLLPSWPVKRVLERAPANWQKTLEQEDAQQRLAANVFRQVALGVLDEHSAKKCSRPRSLAAGSGPPPIPAFSVT